MIDRIKGLDQARERKALEIINEIDRRTVRDGMFDCGKLGVVNIGYVNGRWLVNWFTPSKEFLDA